MRKGCKRHHAVCSPYWFNGRRYFLHAWHSQASFPSPQGANVNNRGWNDRRSWNLRIADTLSPIVPKGGEQEQDWVLFAPFGDAPSLQVSIRRFHSLRSFHQRLLKVGPLWGPEVAGGSLWGNTFTRQAPRRICNPPSKNVPTIRTILVHHVT